MASNPLEQAIKSGVRAGDDLGALFARLGTSSHPRGMIPSAYRLAKRNLRQSLRMGRRDEVRQILDVLRQAVRGSVWEIYRDSESGGLALASKQLAYYGLAAPAGQSSQFELLNQSERAVTLKVEAQAAAALALIATGASEIEIIGDEERQGPLHPGDIVGTAASLAASIWWASFAWGARGYGERFSKQVVAGLDNRTTDCCLRAHGQIQPMAKPFHLTGEPRFADDIDWTPFHWWCRSSIVLYDPAFDMGLTDRMRESADRILTERAAGQRIDRHPADAFA